MACLRKDDGDNDTMEMDKRTVQQLCRERGPFVTPECVTTLHLQSMRFRSVQGLEEFSQVRVLHLESNCLVGRLGDGICHMAMLRVLYLQSNGLTSLGDALVGCPLLDALSVDGNPMGDAGLQASHLPPSLSTLHAASTGLSQSSSLRWVAQQCPQLNVLDVSRNGCAGHDALLALQSVRALRVLYCKANPLVKEPNYRRMLVSGLPHLSYLDDRPVDGLERRGAEAWATGGCAAEQAARLAWRDEKRRSQRRTTAAFAVERARRRLARELAAAAGEDPAALLAQLELLDEAADDALLRLAPHGPMHTVPPEIVDQFAISPLDDTHAQGGAEEHPSLSASDEVSPGPHAYMAEQRYSGDGRWDSQRDGLSGSFWPQGYEAVAEDGAFGCSSEIPLTHPAISPTAGQASMSATVDADTLKTSPRGGVVRSSTDGGTGGTAEVDLQLECSVCSETLAQGAEVLSRLPCGHRFHDRCIRQWLVNFSNTCPICRTPVNPAAAATGTSGSSTTAAADASHSSSSHAAPMTAAAAVATLRRVSDSASCGAIAKGSPVVYHVATATPLSGAAAASAAESATATAIATNHSPGDVHVGASSVDDPHSLVTTAGPALSAASAAAAQAVASTEGGPQQFPQQSTVKVPIDGGASSDGSAEALMAPAAAGAAPVDSSERKDGRVPISSVKHSRQRAAAGVVSQILGSAAAQSSTAAAGADEVDQPGTTSAVVLDVARRSSSSSSSSCSRNGDIASGDGASAATSPVERDATYLMIQQMFRRSIGTASQGLQHNLRAWGALKARKAAAAAAAAKTGNGVHEDGGTTCLPSAGCERALLHTASRSCNGDSTRQAFVQSPPPTSAEPCSADPLPPSRQPHAVTSSAAQAIDVPACLPSCASAEVHVPQPTTAAVSSGAALPTQARAIPSWAQFGGSDWATPAAARARPEQQQQQASERSQRRDAGSRGDDCAAVLNGGGFEPSCAVGQASTAGRLAAFRGLVLSGDDTSRDLGNEGGDGGHEVEWEIPGTVSIAQVPYL